jgi:biopolymer transport protein ExbB/TolQ
MTWTVALDLLVAVLLATSIASTIILSRRLSNMRADRAELQKLAQHFRDATDRADHGVAGLKISAESLQERIDAARTLADDLQFLIERGGGIADRLEAEVRAARRPDTRAKPEAMPSSDSRPKPRDLSQPRSAAERHLLAALRKRA